MLPAPAACNTTAVKAEIMADYRLYAYRNSYAMTKIVADQRNPIDHAVRSTIIMRREFLLNHYNTQLRRS